MPQSTSTLQKLPFKKNPRHGQQEVFNAIEGRSSLNIQLPTGYGKTFTAVGCYSILNQQGKVNRLLIIFPTDAQLEQFYKDGHKDLHDAGIKGSLKVVDVRFSGINSIKKHRKNEAQVYLITVQSLVQARGADNIAKLMETGKWMAVVDEYHHYGLDAEWGRCVLSLNHQFLLAMSATPNRKNDDSAFGSPHVIVSYRDAQKEKAVKPLEGHSYLYRIDAVLENGEIQSFTTDDLVEAAGGESPDAIEAYKISRQMRWSPKYVSPLVTIPVERMLQQSISSEYRLQAIVGAMCVSHAKLVCDQVSTMFPELEVDWVGTGEDGRTTEENKAVLKRFCPPKNDRGERNHTLDILVHVGMAGEGLDSISVSEVIHLNKASMNNSNHQENGRAARYLPGITGHINFDSTSDYAMAGYVGSAIMDAMDGDDPQEQDEEEKEKKERNDDVEELPEEPTIQIWDMDLESIDSGSPEVQRMAEVAEIHGIAGINYKDLDDPDNPEWDKIIGLTRSMRKREAMEHDEKSIIIQWKESVSRAISVVTGRIINMMTNNGIRIDKTLAGDIKKRINRMKKMRCGAITEDILVCKKHYTWVKELERELIEHGIPSWLR